MRTTSFGIANYCVPCRAHCRYCLLSSCGKASGVGETEGMEFAGRVLKELNKTRPDISAFYYIGYCMDTPRLAEYIAFCAEHRCPGASFLQMNGFGFRDGRELDALMESVRGSGVELIDLTFYGTEKYHDRFAGRQGDFGFLLRMLASANRAGLRVNVSVPLIRENLAQMEELRRILSKYETGSTMYFLPHSEGRGIALKDLRITRREFEELPEFVRSSFVRAKHLTEAEWLSGGGIADPETRVPTLVLTPDNFARYSGMTAEGILKELEDMDDRFLAQMPSALSLAERYGDPGNQQLFRLRDLLLKWQQMYIAETGDAVYDMNDESHTFTRHR